MRHAPAPDHPSQTTGAHDVAARESARGPRWLRVAITPILFLLVVAAAVAPLVPVKHLVAEAPLGVQFAVEISGHLLVVALSLGVLWLLARFVQRVRLRDLGVLWSRDSLRLLALGLAISIAITVPAGLILQQLGLLRDYFEPNEAVPAWVEVVLMVSMAFFLQAVPEEWFFRGWLMRVMGHRPVRAIWTSALVFGVIHVISQGPQENLVERLIFVAMATAFGLSCAALAVRLRSVWVAIGIHAGVHVANIIGTLLGMGQGPWLWATGAAGHVIVALYAMRTRPLPDRVCLTR